MARHSILAYILIIFSCTLSTNRENAYLSFVGKQYSLKRFNCRECDSCTIIVEKNNRYTVVDKNKAFLASGRWEVQFEPDAAFYFISFENGPTGVITLQESTVDYIHQIKCR